MRKAIVTAADTSHAISLVRLAQQCAELMPDFDLYVFDLGLEPEDFKNLSKTARIIKYNYGAAPAWHNIKINAGEYAWKPVCIHTVAAKYDFIFWIDAGCYLKNSLLDEIQHALRYGIYASSTRGTLAEYTHPQTLDMIGVPESQKLFSMRAASLIGFDLKISLVLDILRSWSLFALDREVFAPVGSAKHPKAGEILHRQDQSVFTALIAKYQCESQRFPPGARWNWINQQDIDKRPRNIK
jgi:hypothetical protein